MRVHRLEIQAFGPFRGRQVVDLDALTDSGLFLLHGPTGAGKTSVLDAVCFALYGRVPGARAGVTRLRSDHAEEFEAPQVVCEFSVGPRRFEVTRSPAWERPKKRGGGTTTEQARVLVREWRDGAWEPLATRIDEAGDLLDQVLGMGPDQFTKLVLLPQNEFAAFLRADAETRRQLLERLFGTDRFAAVAAWLRDRRAALRADVDAVEQRTALIVARAEQAAQTAGIVPPEAGPDEDPVERVARLAAEVSHAREDAFARREATRAALDQATRAHSEAVARDTRLREHEDLLRRREDVEAGAAARAQAQERLERATRAAALVPLLPSLRAARTRAAAADAALRRAREAWPAPDATLPDAVRDAREADRETLARLASVASDVAALSGLQTQAHDLAARLAEQTTARDAARVAASTLEERLSDHAAALAAAQALADGASDAQDRLETARNVARAVTERERLETALQDLRGAAEAADAHRLAAWEHWLDLRERRLVGIAAELAATLAEGEPCRVCGATEHPAPAEPDPSTVSRDDEEAARIAHDVAVRARDAAASRLAQVRAENAAAVAVAGGTSAQEAADWLADASARVRAAHDASRAVTAAQQAQARDQAALDRTRATLTALEASLEDLRASAERTAERRDGTLRRLRDAAPADADVADAAQLTALRDRLTARIAAADTLLEAVEAASRASEHLCAVERTAATAATEGGFGTLDDAEAAVLASTDTERLRDAVRAHDDERAAVADRLAALGAVDPAELAAWRRGNLPGAPVTAEELTQARLSDEQAAGRLGLVEAASGQLVERLRELRSHHEASRPLRDRFRTIDELTRCLDGTGGGNARRMPLSAYVLAARLEQVAAAATLRLQQMSAGRYALVHTDPPERAGRGRSGLALEVVDAWTGARRDTASLSGGESFYTSLALALGLADVVCAETGGAAIDTLFVDEGFGSLDEDTLEEVMTVLDGLRTGGRCVGVVSHVADLRHRIPAQLEVVRSPEGSSLRLRTA